MTKHNQISTRNAYTRKDVDQNTRKDRVWKNEIKEEEIRK